MKNLLNGAAALVILAGTAGSAAAAGWNDRHDDRHDNHGPGRNNMMHGHPNWRKGGHIDRSDWGRGARVDYRHYHLQKPPRGYEWRRVDNNYVLAAAATGLIAAIMLANQ